jgi:C1A family cysteine protease
MDDIMKRKIIIIIISTLVIGSSVFPLVCSTNKNIEYNNEDCKCDSNIISINGFPIMSDPIYVYKINEGMNTESMGVLPDYFNWKDHDGQDWTTSAKSQGNCGSCWDFAALGALESRINIREGIADLNPDLSEQYVLSCLPKAANHYGQGCRGGSPGNAYKYIFDDEYNGNNCNGIIFESCMPYKASDQIPCEDKCEDWEKYLVPLSAYGDLFLLNNDKSSLDTIKTEIIREGPVAAGMNVTNDFRNWGFTHHASTDYYPDTHEKWSGYLNHLIVIVGWKDDETIGNGGYWICKNSWGNSFGYEGFYNIEYGALFTGWYIAMAYYDKEDYNWPPLPKTNGPYYGKTYEIIHFTGDAKGENPPPYTWYWDFGDGNTSNEQNPTHSYVNTGTYEISLTVTDAQGNYGTDTTTAKIISNNPPNKPSCSYNKTNDELLVTAIDPDGDQIRYGVDWDNDVMADQWTDLVSSGTLQIIDCNIKKGTVSVIVEDEYGLQSDWTSVKLKNMAVEYPIINCLFEKLLQRFPFLNNILKKII